MILMKKKKRSQFEVAIPEPCDMDWDEMDDWSAKERFCQRCEKSVHNLSALTEVEAMTLLERTGWQACVNFEVDEEGKVVYRKPDPTRLERQIEGALRLVAAAAIILPLAACDTPAEASAIAPVAPAPIVLNKDAVKIALPPTPVETAQATREFVPIAAAKEPNTAPLPKPATECEESTVPKRDRKTLFASDPPEKLKHPIKEIPKNPPKKIDPPKIPPKRLGGRPAKVHFPGPKRTW